MDASGNVVVAGTLGAQATTVTTLDTGQGANELYDMDQNVLTTSAVTFATLDTGQGANELYDMDQNVLTTSAVTFATLDTGQGANELYDMDQNVLTTSDVTFDTVRVTTLLDVNEDIDIDLNATDEEVDLLSTLTNTTASDYDLVNLNKTSVVTDASTDTYAGSILHATLVNTETSGVITDTTNLVELTATDNAGWTGYYILAENASGTDRFSVDASGNVVVAGTLGAQATTVTTLDTGQGANELYDMDQNVLTTSAVTFATLDTGQGANELYDMDQNVLTTSAVTFADLTVALLDGTTANIDGDGTPTADLLVVGSGDTTASAIDGLEIVLTTAEGASGTNLLNLTPTFASTTDASTHYALNVGNITATSTTNNLVARAINLGNMTEAGTGTVASTAINVGTGWDTILGGSTAGTNIFSFTNALLTTGGALDVASTIQAGSSNITLTLSTGYIDADALSLYTPALDGASATAASPSGLEVVSDELTLLQGCGDNEILKWDETEDDWNCEADVSAAVAADSLDFIDFEDTLDLDANLALNQTTLTWTQDFTGTTTTGYTYSANSLTTGTGVSLGSTSTAGGASGVSKVLNIARSGTNAQLAHTAYGIYSAVTNTNVTSGTNIAGYFSASGATTANYGLIVENGNVGIGTTAPVDKLNLRNSGAGNQVGIRFNDPTNDAYGGRIYFDDTSNTFRMITFENEVEVSGGIAINRTSGNVGIGTTTPGTALVVASGRLQVTGDSTPTSGEGIELAFTGGNGALLAYNRAASTYETMRYNAIDHRFENSGTEYMRITGGNVGIGDTTPDSKLDVEGTGGTVSRIENSSTGRAQMYLYTVNDDANDIFFGTNGVSQRYSISTRASAEGTDLHIYRNNGGWSNMMTFDWATGNVGIGTTGPLSKLSVGGVGTTAAIIYAHDDSGAAIVADGDKDYDFDAQGSGINYGATSSIRWKRDLHPIDNALDKVIALRGLYFTWDEEHGGKHDMGMIAEEVGKYVPEIVGWDTDAPGYATGMDYGHLTPILVEAIKELDTRTSGIETSGLGDVIINQGNVGIGTTTPNYDLEVVGDIAANSFVNISTRDSKKNISYLSETDTENFLEKIKNLKIAKYDYKTDSGNSAQRLGLIAEEAPSEILTTSGKGVDLYKLTTFALSGIQGLQIKLDDIETRLTNLELDRSQTSSGQVIVQNIGNIVTELFGGAKNFVFDKIKATALAAKDIITDKFLTKEFTIDKTKNGDTDPIVGEAILKEGNSKIVVENNTIQEGDLVFVSILGERAVYWSISNIEVNKSFTVNFNEIQEEDIRFVYWIVHTEDNSSNDENQEAEDDQPLIIDDQPLIIDDQPLTADDQSLITDQLTADDQPLIIDQLTADDQPLVIDSSEDSNISIDSSPEPGVESQTEVN